MYIALLFENRWEIIWRKYYFENLKVGKQKKWKTFFGRFHEHFSKSYGECSEVFQTNQYNVKPVREEICSMHLSVLFFFILAV